jgi:outer membrane protein TolC
MNRIVISTLLTALAMLAGCRTAQINEADREVYRLIERRQRDAIGIVSSAYIYDETGALGDSHRMYDYNPRPLAPELPEAFQTYGPSEPEPDAPNAEVSTQDAGQESDSGDLSASIFTDQQQPDVTVFGLQDALAYAMRNARELQDEKELLYIAALNLSLERHLWTPQFAADIAADFDGSIDKSGGDDGAVDSPGDLDQTFTTVSELSVSQRLPWGGEITARGIHSLMREVRDQVDDGSSADLILDAGIPLLRGAGYAAQTEENRFVAERELIYAVRAYERFRRRFAVGIASDYFDLQQNRAAIGNSFKAYESRKLVWERAEFYHRVGQSTDISEAPRALDSFRSSEANLVSAKESYESALDRFKIRIGMKVDGLLDVVEQGEDEAGSVLDTFLPDVDVPTSVDVATTFRLDLLTRADSVDDERRGVTIARNRILPDLNLNGSVSVGAGDAGSVGNNNLRHDRTDWNAGFTFSTDDRKAERNVYRSSLVDLRKAERDYELAVENVRADVRRAIRRIRSNDRQRSIQALSVEENELRLASARAQYDLGQSTNQDVVDSEVSLLDARNALAEVIAGYRIAILDFRLQTGTLRVTDDGRWGTAPGDVEP